MIWSIYQDYRTRQMKCLFINICFGDIVTSIVAHISEFELYPFNESCKDKFVHWYSCVT